MIYKSALIALIFITFFSCKNNEQKILKTNATSERSDSIVIIKKQNKSDLKLILGKWTWQSEDKSQQFTLDIIKFSNDSVFAKYCAVYNNGNKLDCDLDETINNIKGIVENDKKLKVKFYSFFNAKNGLAEITIIDDTKIKWKITKEPTGEFYAPSDCTLRPKKSIKVTNDKIINLPFDFEKLKNCTQNCSKIYPHYTSGELPKIATISYELTQYEPEVIYLLNNGSQKFQTYIIQYSGDAISQTLINVKNNYIISSQDIGYELGAEDKSYQSFIIDEKLNIDIIDINYKTKFKKVINSFIINSEGKIIKIK